MADPVINLSCKLINIEPDPRHQGRVIVSFRFDDGSGKEPWIQAFSIKDPERQISLEELSVLIKDQKIERPIDSFKFIKESLENGESFDITLNEVDKEEGDSEK